MLISSHILGREKDIGSFLGEICFFKKESDGMEEEVRKIIATVYSWPTEEIKYLNTITISRKLTKNRTFLSKKFKKSTKMFIAKFIVIEKMKRAEQLLRSRYDLDIEEISEIIGIKKPETFYLHFKKKYGVNPRQYRKMNKKEQNRVES